MAHTDPNAELELTSQELEVLSKFSQIPAVYVTYLEDAKIEVQAFDSETAAEKFADNHERTTVWPLQKDMAYVV